MRTKINHLQTTNNKDNVMCYEVKTYKTDRESHFSSYLFEKWTTALKFIKHFQETHGKEWVIELIQEG